MPVSDGHCRNMPIDLHKNWNLLYWLKEIYYNGEQLRLFDESLQRFWTSIQFLKNSDASREKE